MFFRNANGMAWLIAGLVPFCSCLLPCADTLGSFWLVGILTAEVLSSGVLHLSWGHLGRPEFSVLTFLTNRDPVSITPYSRNGHLVTLHLSKATVHFLLR